MAQISNTFELGAPEKIDLQNQPQTNWQEAANFSAQRVEKIEAIINLFKGPEEQAFVQNEQNFLNNSLEFIQSFSGATQRFIEEEQENVRSIQQEIENKKPELNAAQVSLDQIQQAINALEDKIRQSELTIDQLATKKRVIAERINPSELAKAKFKDFLDEAHDTYRWILQVVYKESKSAYGTNFSEQAFSKGKDKGQDFVQRIKGLSLDKLKKDDFDYGRHVLEKKDTFLATMEKGKTNESVRALFEYIANINAVGDAQGAIELSKNEIDEDKKKLDHKKAERERLGNTITVLEGKLKASHIYINKLENLTPLFGKLQMSVQDRLAVQNNYIRSVKGEAGAIENLNNFVPRRSLQTQEVAESRKISHTYTPVEEVDREAVKQTPAVEQGEEEEGFEGGAAEAGARTTKVESKYPVPATDLKESEFANSKKGSCESCNIF